VKISTGKETIQINGLTDANGKKYSGKINY